MEGQNDHSTQRFKEAGTFIMGDDIELKHVAHGILDEHIDRYGSASIEEVTLRLEASNRKGFKRWWIFYIIVISVSFLIILYQGWQINQSRFALSGVGVLPSSFAPSDDGYGGHFEHLSDEQRLILFGDKSRFGPAAQRKALYDSKPDNPAYYVDYSLAYLEEYDSLPPDFIQQGELLDADNGWFLVMLASVLSEDVVIKKSAPRRSRYGRGRRSRSGREAGTKTQKKALTEWEVVDEAQFKESLALLHQAAQMGRFDSYTEAMLKTRLAILPHGKDFVTRFFPLVYIAQTREPSLQYGYLSKVVTAEAQRCGHEKDVEGLKKLVMSWELIGQGMTDDGATLVGGLVARAWVSGNLPYLRDAAAACGLEDMKDRFARLDADFTESKQRRSDRADNNTNNEWRLKAGILESLSSPVINRQVDDTSGLEVMDSKPGRMVDHTFMGKFMSAIGWKLFLLLFVGTVIDSFRGGSSVRKMSINLSGVFNRVDWFWILGLGVIAPFGYYFLVNGFSPLSARELGLMSTTFTHTTGQFCSLCILLGSLPSLLIRWRLSKVAPMLGIVYGKLSVVAIACAVIALPGFGLAAHWTSHMDWVVYGGFSLLVAALILLVINLCRLFWKNKYTLRRLLCARCAMLVYMLIVLLMSLSALLYHAEEKYWVGQDEMFRHSSDEPGFTRLEYRVAQQVKKELCQTMGWSE